LQQVDQAWGVDAQYVRDIVWGFGDDFAQSDLIGTGQYKLGTFGFFEGRHVAVRGEFARTLVE
jgi:hypothetical protein